MRKTFWQPWCRRRRQWGHGGARLRLATVSVAGMILMVLSSGHLVAQNMYTAGPAEALALSRQEAQPSGTHVTLVVRDSSVGFLVRALGKQAHRPVIFDGTNPTFSKRISVRIVKATVMDAFATVLHGTGLSAVLADDGRTIVVRTASVAVRGHDAVKRVGGTIDGRVIDSASGAPVEGSTVTVVGTQLSVVTLKNGMFRIPNVPPGDQRIVARLLGYKSTEQAVTVPDSGRVTVQIVLVPVATMLSGVVTTGTGVQDRRSVGNDITVLNADSIMRIAPVTSVTDLLETRVPGLTVQRTSGVPGAPARLRLRGIGGGLIPGAANTSNDPIVIVDGVRVYASQSTARDQNLAHSSMTVGVNTINGYPAISALDQIDPNSIETIEVFKGPSATSQWGSDAGNGVIVITTKHGRAGPARVSATLNASIERMPGRYAAPNYYRFAHGMAATTSQACSVFAYTGACAETDSIVPFQALNASGLSPFGTGTRQDGSASISGGSEAVTYFVSGYAQREIGYLKMPTFFEDLYHGLYGTRAPSWMRRPTGLQGWGVNTSVVAEPTHGFRLTLSTSLLVSNAARASGQNILASLSGSYIDTTSLRDNPFISNSDGTGVNLGRFVERSESNGVTSTISGHADWSRWSWLLINATMGINTVNREDRVSIPFGVGQANPADTLGSFGIGRGQAVSRSGTIGATLFPQRIVATAIGLQIMQQTTSDYSARADTLQAGVSEPTSFDLSGQQTFASTTAGWYIEPRINLHSRFFISPGFRFDGGSASSRNSSGGGVLALFPKLNFSWLAVDREGQAPLGGFLTALRPRLAFGIAGVQPDPAWKLRLMTAGTDLADPVEGVVLSSLGNPSLHPERSRELEGGFEADFWNGRANLTVSMYSKLRIDAIQRLNLAPSVSSKTLDYYANVGRIRNTGTELTANARIVETDLVAWGVNASLSTNRNVVEKLSGDLPYITADGDGTRLQVGYPITGRWGRPIIGYRTDSTSGRLSLGDIALADSAVYLGAGFPRVQIPFSTNVSLWHGLASVTAAFEYQDGLTQFNIGGQQFLERLYAEPNASLGQQAVALTAYASQVGSSSVRDTYGTVYGLVQTVNTLRFNTLSVNYNVPRSVSKRFRLPQMTVALQGSNLALWTNYRGKDPNVNGTTVGEGVSDVGQSPLPRTWTLRMTFNN